MNGVLKAGLSEKANGESRSCQHYLDQKTCSISLTTRPHAMLSLHLAYASSFFFFFKAYNVTRQKSDDERGHTNMWMWN